MGREPLRKCRNKSKLIKNCHVWSSWSGFWTLISPGGGTCSRHSRDSRARAGIPGGTDSDRKSAFSSFFTTKPFCRAAHPGGPGRFLLFNMPKMLFPCNILSFRVMYSMRAVKKKKRGGGVMAHSLTLYFAFICPLDGFRGLYGVSPYLPL